MESGRCESGYPCSIYEVRRISSMDELWYYAKVFVNSAHERGVDPDIIITMLYATLNELTISDSVSCPNFSDYGNTSAEICEYIIMNNDVPPDKGCTFLYKRVDSKLSACRLCKYHSTLYRNKNEHIERSVIKFMLQSEENISLVTDYVDSSFFESVIDVSLGIPVVKSYALPMMRILFNSTVKPNIRTFLFSRLDNSFMSLDNTTPFDTIWDDAYSNFPRARKLPVVLTNNPVWKDVVRKHIKECIDSASDITREEFLKIANLYLKQSEINEADVFDKKENNDAFIQLSVDEVSISPSLPSSPGDSVNEKKGAEEEPTDSAIGNIASVEKPSVAETSDQEEECLENEHLAGGLRSSCASSASSINPSILSARNVIMHMTLTDVCIHETPLLIKEGEAFPKVYKKDKVVLISGSSSVPGAFYHGVLRDKQLPVEVVKKKDGCFLYLFYSRHMNFFFAADPREMPVQVKELLSRAMIQKICHTPYLLYSVSKAYGYYVKNVFSIQTAHGRMVPGKELLPYKNLIRSYPTSRKYGQGVSSDLTDVCPFFGGMPTYRSICKVLTTMLDNSDFMIEYLNDTLFDEALGYSYLYSLNFEDNGALMILVGNGEFLFKEEFNRSPKNAGIYLSYLTRGYALSYNFFRYVLYTLARKGIFRKCNIQILGIHNGTLNLFVSEEEEEYLSTVIDLLVFEYGRTYSEKGFVVESMRFR